MSIQRQALIHAARLGYQQLSNIVMRERMGHAVGLVPGVLGDVDAAKIADQVEAMTKQREAPPGQAREALEAARGWIVGVAHRVGGHEVVEKIDEALAALSAPTEQVPAGDVLRVLANVIGEYDRNLCTHEETHRGGAIWTICDGCGRKWADDRGGFEPYKDPASVEEARAMLAASPSAPTAVKEAGGVDALAEIAGIKAWAPEDASAHLRYVIDLAKAALTAHPATPVAPIITIDFKQAAELLEMFGGEPAVIRLQSGDASSHSGPGLYAWYDELPEEGANFLGLADDEAAPTTPVTPKTLEALTEHHKLDTDRQVFFYEQDFYILSNFSSFNLKWRGLVFPTSEHAYHWEKFRNPRDGESDDDRFQRVNLARYIRDNAASAHDAFTTANRWKAYRRADWDDVKVGIMLDILRAKAEQHEYVRRKLLATGDRELIEDSWRDDYWGWGPNRDGQNMLGKLWMQVREELRAAKNNMTLGAPDGN